MSAMVPRVLHLRASLGLYGAERAILVLAGQAPGTSVVAGLEDARDRHDELVEEAKRRGLAAVAIPCSGALDPLLVGRVLAAVVRHRIDVVHAHGYKAMVYGLAAARLARRGFVATLHGWTGGSRNIRFYERLELELCRLADGVAAVSPALTERVRQGLGRRARVVYVANGLDVEGTRAAASGPPPASGRYFAVVGRLSVEKGLDLLLDAISLLRDRLRAASVRVIAIGDGPLRAELESRVASEGIGDLFELRGFDPEPARWIKSSIGVLLPSRTEGLPYTALEAMALERPLVATRVGALPQLVEDGAGVLIPPGDAAVIADAIIRLVDDPGLGDRLGRRALEVVRSRWSGEMMARRYLEELYDPACHR
jgi:glycosyltransferase involved in cell wall biosynthesis